jgi:hypothetical protein
MGQDVIGTCALCLRPGSKLQASHIMPAWAYKRIREPNTTNPHPVEIQSGRAVQTSRQITEHLLCMQCEQRFSVRERYAASVVYQNKRTAPIFNLVDPKPVRDGRRMCPARAVRLDVEQICFFGASVLWRGHVSKALQSCSLGDRYGEAFRAYLHGDESFSANCSIVLLAYRDAPDAGSVLARMFAMPTSIKEDGYHSYSFFVCGLQFLFASGKNRPRHYTRMCLAHSAEKRVVIAYQTSFLDGIGAIVAASKPVGGLRRSTE